MMLAGLPVPNDPVRELVDLVREAGELWRDIGQSGVVANKLADRLERAVEDDVKLLALTLDEGRSCSPRSRIHRRRWLSYARCCSPTTSGGVAKGSIEWRSAPLAADCRNGGTGSAIVSGDSPPFSSGQLDRMRMLERPLPGN
jgi:hypothetical protein